MNLQEQKHYYGFHQLPNHWSDDDEKVYTDEFFNDKKYEDLYFDNFFDMDQMFGHENSLFGTRGLPVGHPKRTSKSFNQYNERFGPMVVRVVKDTNLQEQISRIQSIMGLLNEEHRKPSEEEFNQAMEDVKTIIPIISHRIIDKEGLEHNKDTMMKLNKMIRQKVKEGNDEVLDEMWELAGSRIMKNAINVITAYTK